MKVTLTIGLALVLWSLSAPAALKERLIFRSDFPCQEFPAGQMPSEQVKVYGQAGGALEMCSSQLKLEVTDLVELAEKTQVHLYVDNSELTSQQLQSLVEKGAQVYVKASKLERTGLSLVTVKQIGSHSQRGRLHVFVDNDSINLLGLQELKSVGVALHIDQHSADLNVSNLVALGQAGPGPLSLYVKEVPPLHELGQLTQLGIRLQLLK